MLRRASAVAFVTVLAGTTSALAQSCAGVEARVNVRTGQLQAAVEGVIDTTESALIAQELLQRNQLLSAFKVMTAQSATASDQVTTAHKQAAGATASTAVTQANNLAVAEASHRYQSVGYDPCGSNTKAATLYQAIAAEPVARKTIAASVVSQPGKYGDPASWTAAVRSGTVTDGTSLFSGDTSAAAAFINAVVGPPEKQDPTRPSGTARGDAERLGKAERDAMKSVGTVVLSDIAADNATGGPVEQAKALGKHWVGDDGGETWAASIAGDHQRGILQDAVRMEAANLSLLALQVKKGARTETAAATLLLAMINAKVGARLPSPEAGGPK